MSQLKYRLLLIVALCLVSIWALFPRDVTVRERGADGLLRDTVTRTFRFARGSTSRAAPICSSRWTTRRASWSTRPKRSIARSRPSARASRGSACPSPSCRRKATNRIVVQIPGIQDPERARKLVQEQAFLEFKITDKTQALEKDLARIDQIIKTKGLVAPPRGDTAKTGDAHARQQGA